MEGLKFKHNIVGQTKATMFRGSDTLRKRETIALREKYTWDDRMDAYYWYWSDEVQKNPRVTGSTGFKTGGNGRIWFRNPRLNLGICAT